MLRCALAGAVAVLLAAAPAGGQTASLPGPWVIDIRAATSSVPTDPLFYPAQGVAFVPTRGFGADFGGHVYLFTLGPARVGLGANVLMVRSTGTEPVPAASDAEDDEAPGDTPATRRLNLSLRTLAPQISFNFGTGDGWSYLSAGVGIAALTTRVEGETTGEQASGRLRSVNFGGGARWFLTPRVAFGFDVRAHQIAAKGGDSPTPRVTSVAVSAGLSVR